MANVLTDIGKRKVLEAYINSDDFFAHLYKNDFTPGHASVAGDFVEADFVGYEPQVLVNGAVLPAVDAGGRAVATWNPLAWENGGGGALTIYGWYVDDSDENIVIAERFAVPFLLETTGAPINLSPRFTMRSQFANQ